MPSGIEQQLTIIWSTSMASTSGYQPLSFWLSKSTSLSTTIWMTISGFSFSMRLRSKYGDQMNNVSPKLSDRNFSRLEENESRKIRPFNAVESLVNLRS